MEAQVQAMSLGEALVPQQPSNVLQYVVLGLRCTFDLASHCVTLLLIEIRFRQDLIWSSATAD